MHHAVALGHALHSKSLTASWPAPPAPASSSKLAATAQTTYPEFPHSAVDPDPEHFKLRQVQVVMRHGARSPLALMPWETPESFAKTWSLCRDADKLGVVGAPTRACRRGELTGNVDNFSDDSFSVMFCLLV